MMRRMLVLALITLCAFSTASAGEAEKQLREASKAWEAAFNAKDGRGVAATYTDDAILLPPNSDFLQGRDSIAKLWSDLVAICSGSLSIREIFVDGDLACVIGTYELLDTKGDEMDRGKYIEMWTRADGKWKIHRDIWNSSLPLSEPE